MRRERNQNKAKRWLGMMLAIAASFLVSCVVFAYPAIDTSKTASLTVTASGDGSAISGLRFTIYKAADMTVNEKGKVSFTLTSAFASYEDSISMNLNSGTMDSAAWAEGAATLAPYVLADAAGGSKTFESASAVTSESGTVVFSSASQGLYLMTGKYEGNVYSEVTVTPVFLTLPQLSEDQTYWIYDAAAQAKTTTKPLETEAAPQTTSISVRKVWAGDDTASLKSSRPESVTVSLVDGDGNKKDTQVLNDDNAWAFEWTGLEVGEWSVVEENVPKGYSVSQEKQTSSNGETITVTNTHSSNEVAGEKRTGSEETEDDETEEMGLDDENKGKKDKDTGEGGSKSGVNGTSRIGDTSSDVSAERLPQTGQLWWPVWVLAGAAVVLLLAGLFLRISAKRDMED